MLRGFSLKQTQVSSHFTGAAIEAQGGKPPRDLRGAKSGARVEPTAPRPLGSSPGLCPPSQPCCSSRPPYSSSLSSPICVSSPRGVTSGAPFAAKRWAPGFGGCRPQWIRSVLCPGWASTGSEGRSHGAGRKEPCEHLFLLLLGTVPVPLYLSPPTWEDRVGNRYQVGL